uniref:Oxysterol-binding protein n=1 Tax=Ixodes ricinus TaxID=34613 RepID=V5I3D4_IXORI
MSSELEQTEAEMKGWLAKWTNYLKGYQKRWFVLSNGLLSYYRNQAEMAHTCRGTISLVSAVIHTEDSCNFVISNGGTQTFHLKASNEIERQKWVTALELAKARAVRMMESEEDEELDMPSQLDKSELLTVLRLLHVKLEDLSMCSDLIAKHGTALQRSLTDLEQLEGGPGPEAAARVRAVNERATLFRITSTAMMNACSEYVQLAQSQGRKWVRMLQHEHEQCLRLQEMVEQLAKQHSHLERAAKEASQPSQHNSSSAHSDEDEFFDAPEHSAADFVVSIPNKGHRRTASGLSLASEGGASQNAASDTDSEQETGQETGVIRRRTATAVHAAPREGADPPGDPVVRRERRTRVPEKPNCSLSLWSIMKNCIGKELTKIPMPVNFNEPLSTLQRLTEDYEYSELLDRAAKCNDPAVQLVYIAAFAVSSYATTSNRTGKPFNPLLGETYELIREEVGFRMVCEQVSHHPPVSAFHAESPHFKVHGSVYPKLKFWGKSIEIKPEGHLCVTLLSHGEKYTWANVNCCIHNIIVGKLWFEQYGLMEITCHKTHLTSALTFKQAGWFFKDLHRIEGFVYDKHKTKQRFLYGKWTDYLKSAPVAEYEEYMQTHNFRAPDHPGPPPPPGGGASPAHTPKRMYAKLNSLTRSLTGGSQGEPPKSPEPCELDEGEIPKSDSTYSLDIPNSRLLWQATPRPDYSPEYYHFTLFAMALNEMEEGMPERLPRTDCRLRPDMRRLEAGDLDGAAAEKNRLEEKQREARKQRKKHKDGWEPRWFKLGKGAYSSADEWQFTGAYWDRDFSNSPDIF